MFEAGSVKVIVWAMHEYSARCGKKHRKIKAGCRGMVKGEIERGSTAAVIRWPTARQLSLVVNASKYGGDFLRAFNEEK